MKKILIAGIALAIAGCGMSKQEREDVAQLTCNIMAESRNMDSVFRIKEINSAREKLGEKAFLGTDEEIKDSIFNGFCKGLVLNTASYTELKIKAVDERKQILRRAKTASEERDRQRKKVMEKAEERENEAKKVAAKIRNEEIEQKRKLYRTVVEDYIAGYDPVDFEPMLFDVQWVGDTGNAMVASFTCYEDLEGFVRLVLRDDFGEMVSSSHTCSDSESKKGLSVFSSGSKSKLLTEKGKRYFSDREPGASATHNQKHFAMLEGLVVSAELHITGPRKYHNIEPSLETSQYYDDPLFTYSPLASPVIIPLKVQ